MRYDPNSVIRDFLCAQEIAVWSSAVLKNMVIRFDSHVVAQPDVHVMYAVQIETILVFPHGDRVGPCESLRVIGCCFKLFLCFRLLLENLEERKEIVCIAKMSDAWSLLAPSRCRPSMAPHLHKQSIIGLSLSGQLEPVLPVPDSTSRGSDLVSSLSLDAETSVFTTSRCLASGFSALVLVERDPVDFGINSNGSVERINTNDLVVLVLGILSNPVRVEDTDTRAQLSSSPSLGHNLEVSPVGHADTGIGGLTEVDALTQRLLATTTGDTGTVNEESLFGLVTQLVCSLGTRRTGSSDQAITIAVFPGTNSEEEPHQIGLLLLPQLVNVFVCT